MSEHTITEDSRITADEILRVGKLYSSNELRGIQKKLTSASGDLHKLADGWEMGSGLLGSLGDLLSRDQRQLLRNAAQLIDSVGHKVTHAKEKRVRSERQAKRRQDARNARAKQLVAQVYPLPIENHEQQLEAIKAALILNRAKQHRVWSTPTEFNIWLREKLQPSTPLYGRTTEHHTENSLGSLKYDMVSDLQEYLAYDDGSSVEERLQHLQEKVAEAVAQAVLTAEERETLRLWQEVLTPAADRQEGQV